MTIGMKVRGRLSHRLCLTSPKMLLPQHWKILKILIRRSRQLHMPPPLQIKGNVVFHPFPRAAETALSCVPSAICSFQFMLKINGRLGGNGKSTYTEICTHTFASRRIVPKRAKISKNVNNGSVICSKNTGGLGPAHSAAP